MNVFRRKPRQSTEIDITSLIDVMFLLVVFFMVASSFHEETRAVDVALPRAESSSVLSLDDTVLSITISRDDRVFVGEDEVLPGRLSQELNRVLTETGVKKVLIRGDSEAKYQSVISIIDKLSTLDVEGVSFAVLYTSL